MTKRTLMLRAAQRYRNLSIRTKLLLTYLLLILLPLVLLTAVCYVTVSSYFNSSIRFNAGQSFQLADSLLTNQVSSMLGASQNICWSPELQVILKRDQQDTDVSQQSADLPVLNNLLFNAQETQNVFRVSIYVPGWTIYANQGILFLNLTSFRATAQYRALAKSLDTALWLPPETVQDEFRSTQTYRVVSVLRRVLDVNTLGSTIGVVKVSVLFDDVKSILEHAKATSGSVVLLQNSTGETIGASDDTALSKLLPGVSEREALYSSDENWADMTLGGHRCVVTSEAVANTDWKLISVIPRAEIFAQIDDLRNIILFATFGLGLVALAFALRFSSSITRRVSMLLDSIARVQRGDLDVPAPPGGGDEIGKLMDSFHYMVTRIRLSQEEQAAAAQEARSAELKVLQAQINPHFLYNTLELINWKALDSGVPEIAEISQALARFYRTSLSGGRDVVALSNEIEHLQMYVRIQNMRFGNHIRLTVDVPEDLMDTPVLKMLLQPLVENAIMHGILGRSGIPEGDIILRARAADGELLIAVEDDGPGIDEERILGILEEGGRAAPSHGYGARNIHERIRLSCGPAYGLTYESRPGGGTRAVIRVPYPFR